MMAFPVGAASLANRLNSPSLPPGRLGQHWQLQRELTQR